MSIVDVVVDVVSVDVLVEVDMAHGVSVAVTDAMCVGSITYRCRNCSSWRSCSSYIDVGVATITVPSRLHKIAVIVIVFKVVVPDGSLILLTKLLKVYSESSIYIGDAFVEDSTVDASTLIEIYSTIDLMIYI